MLLASEARNALHTRRASAQTAFHPVLRMCDAKIRTAVSHLQEGCRFDVPEFILGVPRYDLHDCIRAVMTHLVQHGFRVHFFYPRTLAIRWTPDHHVRPSQQQQQQQQLEVPPRLQLQVARPRPPPLPSGTSPASLTFQWLAAPASTRMPNKQGPAVFAAAAAAEQRPAMRSKPSGKFVLDLT
jgi:hypothetical protein